MSGLPDLADRLEAAAAGLPKGQVIAPSLNPRAVLVVRDIQEAADALRKIVRQTCSCAEVHGEDPCCIRHGRGTRWAKENPDICELAEKARCYDLLRLSDAQDQEVRKASSDAFFAARTALQSKTGEVR